MILRPTIYIAGPYSHSTPEGTLSNIAAAAQAAEACVRAGWAVHCPHKNFAGFERLDIPYETWLECDIALLRKCDAIFLIEGWESSSGARAESHLAEDWGISRFFARDGVPNPDAVRGVKA